MDEKLKGFVSLNPEQLRKEHARHQAMRDNLRRRKDYKKALNEIKILQDDITEQNGKAYPKADLKSTNGSSKILRADTADHSSSLKTPTVPSPEIEFSNWTKAETSKD